MSEATSSSFQNEGIIDRVVRVALGVAILSLMFVGPKTMWGLIGIVPILTGVIGFCPIYKVFGFSTCMGGDCRKTEA